MPEVRKIHYGWCAAILLSLVLHLCFVKVPSFNLKAPFKNPIEDEKPIEVVTLPPNAFPKDLSLAQSEKALNSEVSDKAKFLSDKNQVAPEDEKASKVNQFKNAQGSMVDSQGLSQSPAAAAAPEGTEGQVVKKKNWKELSLKDLGVGTGTFGQSASTDDYLKDVKEGSRTILSTREYRYFGYYQRIKELLRQHWRPNLDKHVARLWDQGKEMEELELITRVSIVLTPEGFIERISKVSGCGIEEVDNAAITAFQEASPFPNPPKGIIEADGFLRVNWEFILKAESGPRIQFGAPRGGRF